MIGVAKFLKPSGIMIYILIENLNVLLIRLYKQKRLISNNKNTSVFFCKVKFSRIDSLKRHYGRCNVKKEVDALTQEDSQIEITSNPVQTSSNVEEVIKEDLQHMLVNPTNIKECQYCLHVFTRRHNLKRHYGRCKIKKSLDDEKKSTQDKLAEMHQIMSEMDKKVKKLETKNKQLSTSLVNNSHNNTTTNNTTNSNNVNIQQNITIKEIGKEDTSHITDKYYQRILNRGFEAVNVLVDRINFNKRKPENHNLYITNMHSDYINVMGERGWQLDSCSDVIKKMFDINSDRLEEKYHEFIESEEVSDEVKSSINKFRHFIKARDANKWGEHKPFKKLKTAVINGSHKIGKNKNMLK